MVQSDHLDCELAIENELGLDEGDSEMRSGRTDYSYTDEVERLGYSFDGSMKNWNAGFGLSIAVNYLYTAHEEGEGEADAAAVEAVAAA